MFGTLGSFVYRHRRAVLVAWVAVFTIGAAFGGSVLPRLSAESSGSDRIEAARVAERLDDLADGAGEVVAVVDGIDVDDRRIAVEIAAAVADVEAIDGVHRVHDPWSSGADALRADDGRAALVVVTVADALGDDRQARTVDAVTDRLRAIDAPEVRIGGSLVMADEFLHAAERDLQRGEMIALPIALVAMVFIFGGIVAAGLPLVVALVGVAATMIVLYAATVLTDVSVFAINVVTMLGLGLGIDYGLLVVSRFREERGAGLDVERAVRRTVATAGSTVAFSALTVAASLTGLFVFAEPGFTSFGIAGIGVVLVSMAAGVTLLPALLAVLARRIRPATPRSAEDDGTFYRLARFVQRRAVPVVAIVGVGLALLATPFLGAEFAAGDARSLPRSSEVREVALLLAERFPARGADPITAIADAPADDPATRRWVDELSTLPGVAGSGIRPTADPSVTVVDLVPAGTSQGDVARRLVDQVRAVDTAFDVEVGGTAAFVEDFGQAVTDRLPWALAVIGVATFVLLFLMTGSVAVPIKAIVMNLLSLGASFGALVWVFQDGNLSGPLGFEPVGSIDLFMPVLIFIFAFGLSMDYEVFLLSRVKEIHDATGDNDLAVARGLQRTGKIITSAALLIVVVFGGFAAGEVLTIKQLGLGLALAVIVDATIVRSLLVPATMRLLGEWNWWAPTPLRRLHARFGLHEGGDEPVIDVTDDRAADREPELRPAGV